jgi:hypothetical protein
VDRKPVALGPAVGQRRPSLPSRQTERVRARRLGDFLRAKADATFARSPRREFGEDRGVAGLAEFELELSVGEDDRAEPVERRRRRDAVRWGISGRIRGHGRDRYNQTQTI